VPGLELRMDLPEIRVESGDVLELPVRLRVDEAELKTRSSEIEFTLVADDAPALSATESARFLGPR